MIEIKIMILLKKDNIKKLIFKIILKIDRITIYQFLIKILKMLKNINII